MKAFRVNCGEKMLLRQVMHESLNEGLPVCVDIHYARRRRIQYDLLTRNGNSEKKKAEQLELSLKRFIQHSKRGWTGLTYDLCKIYSYYKLPEPPEAKVETKVEIKVVMKDEECRKGNKRKRDETRPRCECGSWSSLQCSSVSCRTCCYRMSISKLNTNMLEPHLVSSAQYKRLEEDPLFQLTCTYHHRKMYRQCEL